MTKFQEKVYNIIRTLKAGQVMTYAQVAKMTGSPRAYRAVGNVLNKNTNPEIPCHRVIRSDGNIGGYNKGTKLKLRLLKNERAIS